MIANYHTHTWRCNHASGTEREYIENAIQAGLRILGFSDHSPYVFPGEYYSHFRMRLNQLEDYVQTVLQLRSEYAGRIEIPLGLELEYYPQLLPKLLPALRDQPIDYVILGQHFIGNEYDASYNGLMTYEEDTLRQYCDQSIDAMQTGLFTYFAHPDLIHYCGDPKVYQKHMRRICTEAKSCGIPLEINLLGVHEGRNYPNVLLWEVAAEEGCNVVLGRDAHNPKALLDSASEAAAMEIVDRYGLHLLETVALRKI